MPDLSTSPDKAITLDTVIVQTTKKHGKLLVVLAIVVVSFTVIYFLTKTKPLSNGS